MLGEGGSASVPEGETGTGVKGVGELDRNLESFWHGNSWALHAPPASSSTDSAPVENLLDASFTDVILKQHKHLEVGGSFVHKNHGSRIFTLAVCKMTKSSLSIALW